MLAGGGLLDGEKDQFVVRGVVGEGVQDRRGAEEGADGDAGEVQFGVGGEEGGEGGEIAGADGFVVAGGVGGQQRRSHPGIVTNRRNLLDSVDAAVPHELFARILERIQWLGVPPP